VKTCGQVTDLSLRNNCVIVEIIQHRRDRFCEANLSALSMPNNPHPSEFKPSGSQHCGQVTDLSLPKNCVILEIIPHRRDRFSEANLSALSMQTTPIHPNSNPRDRSAADRSVTCPYEITASLWKSSRAINIFELWYKKERTNGRPT
jgi:hypothetical protein